MNSEPQIIQENRKTKEIICVFLVVLFLILLRCALSWRLPPYICSDFPHDDGWVVSRAEYLLNGQWMGPYDQYTLIKGVFSPMLMAFSYVIGIPYLQFNTLLYCISCVIFLWAISPVLRNRWIQLASFVVLLFNPITYAVQTGQRIYRNGISQWQILLIFGAIFAIFLRREKKWQSILGWAILAGTTFWSFVNTREDGIWIYPFVLCAIVVTIVIYCLKIKSWKSPKLILFLLPLLIMLLGNGCLKAINYNVYGAALINDRDGGSYADVVRDLYLIEPNPEDEEKFSSEEYKDQYYNIYTSTMDKAYEVSPTLNSMRTEIDSAITAWDAGEALVDGEPYADHILFAIRDGVAAAGYYTSLPETEAVYSQIHQELSQAFQNGSLTKRGISLSAMTAPFQWKYLPDILAEFPKSVQYVISFREADCQIITPSGSHEGITRFENISGSFEVSVPSASLSLSGWAFAYQDNLSLTAYIRTADGVKIADISFSDSQDVYNYFSSSGTNYENARACRFTLELPGYGLSDQLTLCFVDSAGNVVSEIPLAEAATDQISTDQTICYNFDHLEDSVNAQNSHYHSAAFYVNRANRVIGIYQRLNPILSVLAVVAYGYVLVRLILSKKYRTPESASVCLLSSGLLLSFILFVACMSYMNVTTFFARSYLYLSGAYALCLAFIVTTLGWGVHDMILLCQTYRKSRGFQHE